MIMGGSIEGKTMIDIDDLPPEVSQMKRNNEEEGFNTDYSLLALREAREMFERHYLETQISRFKGNVSKTAEFVGMERSALHRKLKSLDISLSDKQDEQVSDSAKRKSA